MTGLLPEARNWEIDLKGDGQIVFRIQAKQRLAQSAALLYLRIHVVTRSPDLDITFPVQLAIPASFGMRGISADSAR
jgi:hypothetical protein